MARKLFISYEGHDRMKAKGFNLLRWNKNVNFDFVGRHLLDPVKSNDPGYIETKIKEQLVGTSATVVLLGTHTEDSDWVKREIELSLAKGNGLLGIKLTEGAEVPQQLVDAGAEIIGWNPNDFEDAIERAIMQGRRVKQLETIGATDGGSCSR